VDGRRVGGSAVGPASTEQHGDYRDGLACLHRTSLSLCVSLGTCSSCVDDREPPDGNIIASRKGAFVDHWKKLP
jgi:hypothetical protein